MRRAPLAVALVLAGLSLSGPARVEAPPERAYAAFSDDPARRFDFWIGEWEVQVRNPQPDLTFADSARGRSAVYSILGGKAVVELWDSGSVLGFTLAYHDASARRWVLWSDWPEPNRSRLERRAGVFRHGRGEFADRPEGIDAQATFRAHTLGDITPFSLRREDRITDDGGRTWAHLQEMEYTRTAIDPKWPIRRDKVPTYHDGGRCDVERFQPLALLAGAWRGATATLDMWPVLDGCALMGFLDDDAGGDAFVFVTFDTAEERWLTAILDEAPDAVLLRFLGEEWGEHLSSDGAGRAAWAVSRRGPGSLGTAGDELIFTRGDRTLRLTRVDDSP